MLTITSIQENFCYVSIPVYLQFLVMIMRNSFAYLVVMLSRLDEILVRAPGDRSAVKRNESTILLLFIF